MNDIPPIRSSPGVFTLQTEQIRPGDVFAVDDDRSEVGSELVAVGHGTFLAHVPTQDGQVLGAQLHTGRKIN